MNADAKNDKLDVFCVESEGHERESMPSETETYQISKLPNLIVGLPRKPAKHKN